MYPAPGLQEIGVFQQVLHPVSVLTQAEEVCLLLSVLNVAAYSGDSVLDTLDFNESGLADCAEVRMSRDGSTVTVTNTRLDVATAAEATLALDTVVSSPAGSTQLVVVSARNGNVRLVVSVPAPRDAQQAAGEAGLLIDAVLAELEPASL